MNNYIKKNIDMLLMEFDEDGYRKVLFKTEYRNFDSLKEKGDGISDLSDLILDYYDNFLSDEETNKLYNSLLSLQIKKVNRRSTFTFGDPGLVYTIKFPSGKTSYRPVSPWSPELLDIKKKLEILSDAETYTICVVMFYPNGSVGINPHRDKEMIKGTQICGISLGQTRTLRMIKENKKVNVHLSSGSLYIFRPPTNDKWAHSIVKDKSINPRISLTFRNYKT
jgi:hypothetical protein